MSMLTTVGHQTVSCTSSVQHVHFRENLKSQFFVRLYLFEHLSNSLSNFRAMKQTERGVHGRLQLPTTTRHSYTNVPVPVPVPNTIQSFFSFSQTEMNFKQF